MSIALITGSCGLVGSEAALGFADLGLEVVGIDNDMRAEFFGAEASTEWNRRRLATRLGERYTHHSFDVRDRDRIDRLFRRLGSAVGVVIHTAAQPSHDWAARQPFTDFDINATGTLNLLEAARRHARDAPFIFTSTNKVYGDRPNALPLIEQETRWEIEPHHPYAAGIPEEMSVDASLHSLFGASKLAADVLVQEYGRYFDMPTACFRGGTLTGPSHSPAELHGFLAYVMRCAVTGTCYSIYGHKGKQVRDAIHSSDLVRAFQCFFRAPRAGEVYNIGGGRFSNISVIEAIALAEEVSGRPVEWRYVDASRKGDHTWWIGDNGRFKSHFAEWALTYDVRSILDELYEVNVERWLPRAARTR
ncbi:MAG: NAD-dependent epimerase/dehydratase family protein [Thermoleophilaceae bacterium]|nr:NAD-dependent epimerase/dehydratase family protein [Thermoleophilaceae bacterium]